jgi:hypothetical protein
MQPGPLPALLPGTHARSRGTRSVPEAFRALLSKGSNCACKSLARNGIGWGERGDSSLDRPQRGPACAPFGRSGTPQRPKPDPRHYSKVHWTFEFPALGCAGLGNVPVRIPDLLSHSRVQGHCHARTYGVELSRNARLVHGVQPLRTHERTQPEAEAGHVTDRQVLPSLAPWSLDPMFFEPLREPGA